MNVFEALREDHDRQRELISQLVKTEGDSEERDRLYKEIKAELEAHAAAEEKYFYRPLMKHDLTLEKARHSVAEHKELDDLLESLDDKEMSSAGWLVKAKQLEERLIHHLDEEEHEVFQMAGKALTESEKEKYSSEYQEDKRQRQ